VTASRWRVAAGAAVVLSVALVLAAARDAGLRYGRAFAERAAWTTAAYLTVVTPARPRDPGAYDLAGLLVQGRALATLPGFTPGVEVYGGTAPLIRAFGAPLDPSDFAALADSGVARWIAGAALVPLRDRTDSVVGAVAVPGKAPWRLADGFLLVAALAALVLGLRAIRAIARVDRDRIRRLVLDAGAAGLLFAAVAALDIRGAGADATDRWLADTRLLLVEAAARAPRGLSADRIARITRGAVAAPGDSSSLAPRRRRIHGEVLATAAVRLGPGRWITLATAPLERTAGDAVLIGFTLACVGPLVLAFAAWRALPLYQPRARRPSGPWGY